MIRLVVLWSGTPSNRVDEGAKQQVTVRKNFGVAAEVRYLHERPEIGDFVSHRNDFWVVASIQVSSLERL